MARVSALSAARHSESLQSVESRRPATIHSATR
eukprot:CAMPEP_0174720390 /NCGR_PEP_ID=MMETSP1094-20130205/33447_1 /TAXON_ID=156173 /ORGANISM="Chrysochromulina brevifilum, Strain UTEX LB 985" /LENGTH=32 /DNA_ID= /DNA_START= /DNA_END= /DNA_ORIENTATION=